jgi:hypothetical protein
MFGSCIIQVLFTGCAKIKKKFLLQKVKNRISNFALFARNSLKR